MNFISQLILERRRKKSNLKFTRNEILSSKPVRNSLIKWEKNDNGEVSLVVPLKSALWVRIISKIFVLPKSRVIVLDEVGSFVWGLCDGHNSVNTIINALCSKYKLTRKEAETSLLEYFRKLGKRGIVGFLVTKKSSEM